MADTEARSVEARSVVHTNGVHAPFMWAAGLRIPAEWTLFENVSDDTLAQLEDEREKGQVQLREPAPAPVALTIVKPAPSKASLSKAAKRKAQG